MDFRDPTDVSRFKVNWDDLFECPNYHLQLAAFDSILCTILPERGIGKFRPTPINQAEIYGMGLAKSLNGSVLPDDKGIFTSVDQIRDYLDVRE